MDDTGIKIPDPLWSGVLLCGKVEGTARRKKTGRKAEERSTMKPFGNDWDQRLGPFLEEDWYVELRKKVAHAYNTGVVYPAPDDVYRALRLTPYESVKVVILGQDPYPGMGQAHGLSFSVRPGVALPKSLQNIFRELVEDVGCEPPRSGDLTPWAEKGVLLLNTVLTVAGGSPASHRGWGWERVTDEIIRQLNDRPQGIVFILWGRDAQQKAALITNPVHRIIRSPHPSPLAAYRGFFGSKPFSTANRYLIEMGENPIDWSL